MCCVWSGESSQAALTAVKSISKSTSSPTFATLGTLGMPRSLRGALDGGAGSAADLSVVVEPGAHAEYHRLGDILDRKVAGDFEREAVSRRGAAAQPAHLGRGAKRMNS